MINGHRIKPLTFDEFRATGEATEDMIADVGWLAIDPGDQEEPVAGRHYVDAGWFIEDTDSWTTFREEIKGKWTLDQPSGRKFFDRLEDAEIALWKVYLSDVT